MKKIIALILCSLFLISQYQGIELEAVTKPFKIEINGSVMDYRDPLINVLITGKPINTGDMPAVAINGRTLLPVREFFESHPINAKVEWSQETQEIFINYKDKNIVLRINDKTAYVNGVATELDVPATIIRDVSVPYGKTMVPLRFISESLGFEVDWIAETYTANVIPPQEPIEDVSMINWSLNDNQVRNLYTQQNSTSSEEMEFPLARIKGITQDLTSEESYLISADGPISHVKVSKWSGMLIIDLVNTSRKLSKDIFSFGDTAVVKEIRTSQYTVDPMVTRYVFHFNEIPTSYSISLSEDRKQVKVTILKNQIIGIKKDKDEVGEYIQIESTQPTDIITSRLEDPTRVIFDISSATNLLGANEAELDSELFVGIRVGQFDYTTVRVVVEAKEQPGYSIEKSVSDYPIDGIPYKKHITMIRFNKIETIDPTTPSETPLIGNPSEKDGVIFWLPLPSGITTEMIDESEDVRSNKYTITLQGNHIDFYSNKVVPITNANVNNITYELNTDGNTNIEIQTDKIYVYTLRVEEGQLRVNIRNPRDVYDKIVIVDPGHGGKMSGATYSNIQEKVFNYRIYEYLEAIINAQEDIKVYYTRIDDTDPSFDFRSGMAESAGADIFISIHNNALPSYPSVNGTIVFYQQKMTGEMNTLSKGLANILQKTITGVAGTFNRGVRTADYRVLRDNTVPGVLLECAFMTNPKDMENLQNDQFLMKIAQGIFDGMTEYFDTYPTGR